jgi:hypothetical protein
MAKRWNDMTIDELWKLFMSECELIGYCVVKGHNYNFHLKRAKRLEELMAEKREASNER